MKGIYFTLFTLLLSIKLLAQVENTDTSSQGTIRIKKKYESQKIAAGNSASYTIIHGTLWYIENWREQNNNDTLLKNVLLPIGYDTNWIEVKEAYLDLIGLKSDGTIWEWGRRNYNSVAAVNTMSIYKSTPVQIGSDNNWANIASGYYCKFGIKSDGSLWGWGSNYWGQLGDGTKIDKTTPTQIGADNKWISIVGGQFYTMGLKSDGTLWAWGNNQSGQLGDGTLIEKLIPTQIGADSKWIKIAPGSESSYAIKSDSTLWAWGYNKTGLLGDGTVANRKSPFQIGKMSKWIDVSASPNHTLAIKSDKSLWTWGDNSNGQLGDGTSSSKDIPEQIGKDKWEAISASNIRSLGLKTDNSLWGWGNPYPYGIKTDITKNIPIQIKTGK